MKKVTKQHPEKKNKQYKHLYKECFGPKKKQFIFLFRILFSFKFLIYVNILLNYITSEKIPI